MTLVRGRLACLSARPAPSSEVANLFRGRGRIGRGKCVVLGPANRGGLLGSKKLGGEEIEVISFGRFELMAA